MIVDFPLLTSRTEVDPSYLTVSVTSQNRSPFVLVQVVGEDEMLRSSSGSDDWRKKTSALTDVYLKPYLIMIYIIVHISSYIVFISYLPRSRLLKEAYFLFFLNYEKGCSNNALFRQSRLWHGLS